MWLQVKKLGLWDYMPIEIGITGTMFEIGITGFQSNPNQGFQLQDYMPFEIGITGLLAFLNWDYGFTGPPPPYRALDNFAGFHCGDISGLLQAASNSNNDIGDPGATFTICVNMCVLRKPSLIKKKKLEKKMFVNKPFVYKHWKLIFFFNVFE